MKKLALLFLLLFSCTENENKADLLTTLENYLEAKAARDNSHWQYLADTVRTWFDEKTGPGNIQVRGKASTGPWVAWDEEMNAYSVYDSLKADYNENSVTGIFYEHNQFYDLIGKSEGTKSQRTFWFDKDGLLREVLIQWAPENISTDKYLEPVLNWALKNDSLEIMDLYKDHQIIPSKENAQRWKVLLEKYNKNKTL